MYKLFINCLIVLKSIYDYEYESGIEFKCIDKEYKEGLYNIFINKILPVISDEDKFKRTIRFIKGMEDSETYTDNYIGELHAEIDNLEAKYKTSINNLESIYHLLSKDGINSKRKAKEFIIRILEEVKNER